MDLPALRGKVTQEIDSYQPDELGLCTVRAALVDPYWIDVELRDTIGQIEADVPLIRSCVVVLDDGSDLFVVLDPVEGDFMLAERSGVRHISIGVRGCAVGCFLAR